MCNYNDCGWCYAPESVANTNSEGGGCYNPKECKANTSINIVNVETKVHCDYKPKMYPLDLESFGMAMLGYSWFEAEEAESDVYRVISNFVEQYNRVVLLVKNLNRNLTYDK